jgi:uncharacterized protein YcbK (DUF882 family)
VAEMDRRRDAWAATISLHEACVSGKHVSLLELRTALDTAVESGVGNYCT